jgi:hypothetical protein
MRACPQGLYLIVGLSSDDRRTSCMPKKQTSSKEARSHREIEIILLMSMEYRYYAHKKIKRFKKRMSVHITKKLRSFHELRGDFRNSNDDGCFDACLLCSRTLL